MSVPVDGKLVNEPSGLLIDMVQDKPQVAAWGLSRLGGLAGGGRLACPGRAQDVGDCPGGVVVDACRIGLCAAQEMQRRQPGEQQPGAQPAKWELASPGALCRPPENSRWGGPDTREVFCEIADLGRG